MRDRDPRTRWAAVVGSTVGLLVAALLPSPFRRHPGWKWLGPDKLLHLIGHAGYVLTLVTAFSTGRLSDGNAAVLAVCVSTVHGLVTGRVQRRVPGRAFEPMDLLAGVVGAILAAVSWYALQDPSARTHQ